MINPQMIESEIWSIAKTKQGNAILVKFKKGEKVIPIFLGPLEAQSLLLGLGEIEIHRPLAHDLILKIFEELSIKLCCVEIHSLSKGTYYSHLIIEQDDIKKKIDARPSDAITLAVKMKRPIFVHTKLMKENGISLDRIQQCWEERESQEIDLPETHSLVPQTPSSLVNHQLSQLIVQKDDEKAVKIRDLIQEVEKN